MNAFPLAPKRAFGGSVLVFLGVPASKHDLVRCQRRLEFFHAASNIVQWRSAGAGSPSDFFAVFLLDRSIGL
jgi:hypothetical protein